MLKCGHVKNRDGLCFTKKKGLFRVLSDHLGSKLTRQVRRFSPNQLQALVLPNLDLARGYEQRPIISL